MGRLAIKQKGLDLLISGFSEYRAAGGSGKLWLVGEGPDKCILEDMCEHNNIKNEVRFLGVKFGEEKIRVISRMDVFVHTSRWDGIPMSVLEAAGLSKPA